MTTTSEELIIQKTIALLDKELEKDSQESVLERVNQRVVNYYRDVMGRDVDENLIRVRIEQSIQHFDTQKVVQEPTPLEGVEKKPVTVEIVKDPRPTPSSCVCNADESHVLMGILLSLVLFLVILVLNV